jgi:hypothetical protein
MDLIVVALVLLVFLSISCIAPIVAFATLLDEDWRIDESANQEG